MEQLNMHTSNHGINIIKVNVGCSTIIAYCALNAHFPVLLMSTKRTRLHAPVRLVFTKNVV